MVMTPKRSCGISEFEMSFCHVRHSFFSRAPNYHRRHSAQRRGKLTLAASGSDMTNK